MLGIIIPKYGTVGSCGGGPYNPNIIPQVLPTRMPEDSRPKPPPLKVIWPNVSELEKGIQAEPPPNRIQSSKEKKFSKKLKLQLRAIHCKF